MTCTFINVCVYSPVYIRYWYITYLLLLLFPFIFFFEVEEESNTFGIWIISTNLKQYKSRLKVKSTRDWYVFYTFDICFNYWIFDLKLPLFLEDGCWIFFFFSFAFLIPVLLSYISPNWKSWDKETEALSHLEFSWILCASFPNHALGACEGAGSSDTCCPHKPCHREPEYWPELCLNFSHFLYGVGDTFRVMGVPAMNIQI